MEPTDLVVKTYTTECGTDLIAAINAELSITPELVQIINRGDGTLVFQFASEVSVAEQGNLDTLLASFECPIPDPTLSTDDGLLVTDADPAVDSLWSSQKVSEEVDNARRTQPVHIDFGYHNTAQNRWLELNSSGNRASNELPFVVPFPTQLNSMTFININRNVDVQVQIWVAGYNVEMDTIHIPAYTYDLHDVRAATIPVNISLNAGDKVSVFLRDIGTNSRGPVVSLYGEMMIETPVHRTDNTSSDFRANFDDDDD